MVDRVTPEFAEPVRATERMVTAWRQTSFARRTWFAVTLAVIFAAHATLLALFLWHDDPPSAARAEETPVEVVAEMPEPPPPKPPAPAAHPAAPQPPEKPATSAPRAQNDEKTDRDAGEAESRAPKAKLAEASPPPAPPQETPQPQPMRDAKLDEAKPEDAKPEDAKPAEAKPSEAKPDRDTPDEAKPQDSKPEEAKPDAAKAAEAAAPPVDPSEAEALDKAPPEPPHRPAELASAPPPKPSPPKPSPPKPPPRPARLAMAKPQLLPQALPTAIDQLAGSSDLPDYVFAKPQRKPTKYKGGTEDSRYLAIVYAMVTQSHEAISLPGGDWQVAVAFQVDGHGDLVGLELTQSSGYAEVDRAAVDAVRRAAPFPPPPSGGLTGMIARLNAAHARAAMGRP